jgi:hypothetical protein
MQARFGVVGSSAGPAASRKTPDVAIYDRKDRS